jgi:hypothetical protein
MKDRITETTANWKIQRASLFFEKVVDMLNTDFPDEEGAEISEQVDYYTANYLHQLLGNIIFEDQELGQSPPDAAMEDVNSDSLEEDDLPDTNYSLEMSKLDEVSADEANDEGMIYQVEE